MSQFDKAEAAQIRADFRKSVNMSPAELERWLQTEESRAVGWKGDDGKGSGESIGHASGRHIIQIKRKRVADLSGEDLAHMKKVVSYVARHLAQRPADTEHSRWRYSLMNWGHDPQKKGRKA